MHYPIAMTRDDDGTVVVTFLDFPGAQATGEYDDKALARARDALTGALGRCIRERRPIPRPSPGGRHRVQVSPLVEIKLGIYEAMREANIGRAELARRLGWHRPQVDRLLDVRHGSKLNQLEAALTFLGRRLVVSVEPSDR